MFRGSGSIDLRRWASAARTSRLLRTPCLPPPHSTACLGWTSHADSGSRSIFAAGRSRFADLLIVLQSVGGATGVGRTGPSVSLDPFHYPHVEVSRLGTSSGP